MTISTKKILDTETFPKVDFDFMNETHFEEIEIVNELGRLITAYQQDATFTENEINKITYSLACWLQHTQTHFDRENMLMMNIQFPMYLVHSSEHSHVLKNMNQIVKAWKNNNDIEPLVDYVFTVWPEWFVEHVESMDMVTAQFAVMVGYDPHSQPSEQ
ncbi:MAG: hemerythrin family protein [Piscirickettsiaceae bacterium]|nr:hemerythrin family protein [Piscirickettsiaceae bacterium]